MARLRRLGHDRLGAERPRGELPRADLDEAARRLAGVLDEEDADVLVGYDWHGGYGHPDHVKVHAVMHRAAELAGTRRYLEWTMNRDAMIRSHQAAMAAGSTWGVRPERPMDDGNPLGSLESELHWACDVSEFLEVKRSALKADASQSDAQGMLEMPMETFAVAFAWEHYIEPGRPEGMVAGWFLDG